MEWNEWTAGWLQQRWRSQLLPTPVVTDWRRSLYLRSIERRSARTLALPGRLQKYHQLPVSRWFAASRCAFNTPVIPVPYRVILTMGCYSSLRRYERGPKNWQKDHMTLSVPVSGVVYHPYDSTCYEKFAKFEVSISTCYEDMKGDAKCRKWGALR